MFFEVLVLRCATRSDSEGVKVTAAVPQLSGAATQAFVNAMTIAIRRAMIHRVETTVVLRSTIPSFPHLRSLKPITTHGTAI
jgi:hypothetical protein